MGTVSNTTEFRELGVPSPVSRGGKTLRCAWGKVAMSASYATNGDTLALPAHLGTLVAVVVTPTHDGTRLVTWDGGTSTPKLKAYSDLDATPAEVANATDLSAVTRTVLAYFES